MFREHGVVGATGYVYYNSEQDKLQKGELTMSPLYHIPIDQLFPDLTHGPWVFLCDCQLTAIVKEPFPASVIVNKGGLHAV